MRVMFKILADMVSKECNAAIANILANVADGIESSGQDPNFKPSRIAFTRWAILMREAAKRLTTSAGTRSNKISIARLLEAHPAMVGHANERDCSICALIVELEREEMQIGSSSRALSVWYANAGFINSTEKQQT